MVSSQRYQSGTSYSEWEKTANLMLIFKVETRSVMKLIVINIEKTAYSRKNVNVHGHCSKW